MNYEAKRFSHHVSNVFTQVASVTKNIYYRKLRIKRLRFFYCFSTITTNKQFLFHNITLYLKKNVIKKNFLEEILLKIDN